MKSKSILLLILILSVIFVGCRDRHDVDDLAIVIAVGVDKLPGRDPILLTVQIVAPSPVKGSKSSKGSTDQESKSFIVLTSQGKSLLEAIDKLSKISPLKLFFSHNKIVVLGRSLAETNISEIMDYMERDREFRRINWILVAEKSAKQVLETPTVLEKYPAQGIAAMLTSMEQTAVYPINRNDFILQLKSDANISYAPVIRVADPQKDSVSSSSPTISLEEMAIFKNNRMIGTISPAETKGLLWLINKVNGDTVSILYPSEEGPQEISLEITEVKTKVIPHITAEGSTMEITCTANAIMRETENVSLKAKNIAIVRQIEQAAENALKARIEQTIIAAQQRLQADFLGYGNRIHDANPREWRLLEADWAQRFPTIKSTVTVKVTLLQFGKSKSSATLKDRKD